MCIVRELPSSPQPLPTSTSLTNVNCYQKFGSLVFTKSEAFDVVLFFLSSLVFWYRICSKMWLYCFVPHRFNVRIVKYVCVWGCEGTCAYAFFLNLLSLGPCVCACVCLLFALGRIRFRLDLFSIHGILHGTSSYMGTYSHSYMCVYWKAVASFYLFWTREHM